MLSLLIILWIFCV